MTIHRDAILDALARRLEEGDGARIYALLDCAREDELHGRLTASGHKKTCLYKGAPPELEAVAPWLVDLEFGGGAFQEWVVERGWGKSWGVFLISQASLGELRKHFRRFLQVYTEAHKKLYFRFHDPRVLRPYLPTCTREELDFVIGPVSWFLVEGSDPRELLEFCLDEEDGLSKHVLTVGEADPVPAPETALPPEVAAVLADLEGGESGNGGEELERVRDALAAHPGQADLLGFVRDLGGRQYAAACVEAGPFRDTLEALSERRFEIEVLQPLLGGFSEGSWRAAYTALAPKFQSWLRAEERSLLGQSCQALIDLAEFTQRVHDLRARLREAKDLGEAAEEERAAKATLAALKEMQATAAAWPEDDARLEKIRTGVDRLVGRLEGRLSPRSATSGLTSLLVTLGRGDAQESARVARGVLGALAGTDPSDGKRNGGGRVSLPEVASREGRYTMRRKALPFQRSQLVMRDDQIQALAEANWRDRAARLRAYARETHSAKVEELGQERLADIVEHCMETALEQSIGKMTAVQVLLDIMITIDPEFTELDEYAWANAILTSGLLDPDTKPDLIWDQLEV